MVEEQQVAAFVGDGDRWIGLHAPAGGDTNNDRSKYAWMTEEPVSFTFWHPSNPNSGSPCVALLSPTSRWVDRPCEQDNVPLCEREE